MKTSIFAIISVVVLSTSCSKPQPAADAQVFDHIEQFAKESAHHLIDSCQDGIARQAELLRAAARAEALESSGDTALSVFYKLKIEQLIREANPEMADTIFKTVRAF
jgi:hypothetical protein